MSRHKECFVVMPFSETTHGEGVRIPKGEWDHIYDEWIKKAIESYRPTRMQCKRSPAIPGNFIRGIVADLANADLVVADITGGKPNVFYEVGIRHALKTGTILITQAITEVPSDLRGYYTFAYEYIDKTYKYESAFAAFKTELHEKIAAFEAGRVLSDGPVSDFLGFRADALERAAQRSKTEIGRLLRDCQQAMTENYQVFEFLLRAVKRRRPIPLERWPIIDTLPFDVLYGKIVGSVWEQFSEKSNAALRQIVGNERHVLLMVKHHWDGFFAHPSDETASTLVQILDYAVNERKPTFEKCWPQVIAGLEASGLVLTVKDGKKRRQLRLEKPTSRSRKSGS